MHYNLNEELKEILKKTKLLSEKQITKFLNDFFDNYNKYRNYNLSQVFQLTLRQNNLTEHLYNTQLQSLIYTTALVYDIKPKKYDFKIIFPQKKFLSIYNNTYGKTLSKNLYKYSENVTKEIYNNMKKNVEIFGGYEKALKDNTKLILSADKQKLPKYLKELKTNIELLQISQIDKKELLESIENVYLNVTQLKETRHYKKILTDLLNKLRLDLATDQKIQKYVKRILKAKATSNAERITITENSRVYEQNNYNKMYEDDTIEYIKFYLSSSHKEKDICDVYANQDLYNLGKGIFTKNTVPYLPIHPNGRSYILPFYPKKERKFKEPTKAKLDKLSKNLPKSQKKRFLKNEKMIYINVNKDKLTF